MRSFFVGGEFFASRPCLVSFSDFSADTQILIMKEVYHGINHAGI